MTGKAVIEGSEIVIKQPLTQFPDVEIQQRGRQSKKINSSP